MTDFTAPKWGRELARFLPAKPQFIVWGNIRDVYPIKLGGGITTLKMDAFLNAVLREQGYSAVVKYEPLIGFTVMNSADAETVNRITGLRCGMKEAANASLPEAASAIEKLVTDMGSRCAVLMDFASRIHDLCGNDDSAFFYRMMRLMETAVPKVIKSDGPAGNPPSGSAGNPPSGAEPADASPLYSPIIWILDKENDLPSWYLHNSSKIRSLPIPMPDHEIRRHVAAAISPRIDGWTDMDENARSENLKLFISQTTGLMASEMVAVAQMTRREGLKFGDIGEAIRRYKLGIVENLWAKLDHSRVANAEDFLSRGVMGQPRAVRHVANVLKRSVYSLSGSQFSRYTQRPKGVLFFAGPTGVGKTELAKSVTELVFGSPTNFIRFDMSEFGHEHADQRLVGSPPGYVGYDVGGELTNAIKQNPFSVVLFDEVEKAHPKIMDMFLQILDDGRLTSGRGETVYFSESLIIFTSNLGVYEQLPNGAKRQIVTPDMPYEDVERKMMSTIDDFFRYKINRPEILNRIGKNIIVFDFIRNDTAAKIFDKMLANVVFRLEDSHGIALSLSDAAREQLLSEICADLSMGGRGVGNTIEEALVNPLSRSLFEHNVPRGGSLVVNGISRGENGWELNVSVR